ncbi:hypothetical protein [Lentzea sp. NEAU-D7]
MSSRYERASLIVTRSKPFCRPGVPRRGGRPTLLDANR